MHCYTVAYDFEWNKRSIPIRARIWLVWHFWIISWGCVCISNVSYGIKKWIVQKVENRRSSERQPKLKTHEGSWIVMNYSFNFRMPCQLWNINSAIYLYPADVPAGRITECHHSAIARTLLCATPYTFLNAFYHAIPKITFEIFTYFMDNIRRMYNKSNHYFGESY